jgi:hypothetical protein
LMLQAVDQALRNAVRVVRSALSAMLILINERKS